MKQLRIMTFNIQHCMNYITREIDYPLFAKTIAESGADIVGLNEVRGESETEGYDDQARILAEGAGYKYHYFAEAIRFNGRDPYGMCRSLEKLVDLAGSQQTSALSKRFSSHPDSAMRAERMRKKADAATKK